VPVTKNPVLPLEADLGSEREILVGWMSPPPGNVACTSPHFMVGMANSAPSFTPEGQRAVTVLVRV
jgi:hypothetical protein